MLAKPSLLRAKRAWAEWAKMELAAVRLEINEKQARATQLVERVRELEREINDGDIS